MRLAISPFLLVAAAASASTSLTYQGTISSGPSNVGDPISFTVTLSDDPAAPSFLGSGTFSDFSSALGPDLYASMVGTYIAGSWIRPSVDENSPNSYVMLGFTAVNQLLVSAGMDGFPKDIGLTFLGSTVKSLYLDFSSTAFATDINPPAANYADLFTGRSGIYAYSAPDASYFETNAGVYYLDLTSLTIGSTPVPEPSTYGLILGGLALAGAAVRRRKLNS